MKDQLLQLAARTEPAQRPNVAREYLQLYLLRLLHEAGANRGLALVGGAALRLLQQLPRFSEALDFSLVDDEDVDAVRLFQSLKDRLQASGYTVTSRARVGPAVASASYRFVGIPREVGWSPDPRISVSVRLEVDLRPPAGAKVETSLIQRFFPIALRHHDLPSLFAGKLHALIARPFVKGRDWFDLVWYLTEKRGLEPNRLLLENALEQTGHRRAKASSWRKLVRERLRKLKWADVVADLAPFLERPADLDQLSPELVRKLL